MLWPTDYNPFTFLSRNHQHFALTGYIALIVCHRRFSTLHRRRQSNTASSASRLLTDSNSRWTPLPLAM